MSSMLASTISSSRIQSPSIPNVITEAIESGSSNISSLFIDNMTDITVGLEDLFTIVVA